MVFNVKSSDLIIAKRRGKTQEPAHVLAFALRRAPSLPPPVLLRQRRDRHYQSMIVAPQVNPEPNATHAIFIPRLSLPDCSASHSRIGIVAAVVLP